MADFVVWATAADLALGFPAGGFMNAYRGNRAELVQEAVEADPVGAGITALMEKAGGTKRGGWEGTCKELNERLHNLSVM